MPRDLKYPMMIAGGKIYYLVATGLRKTEARELAALYRSKGNLARLRKHKHGLRWDVYAHGRVGMTLRGR